MVTLHETARVPYRADEIRAYGKSQDHKATRLARAALSAALGRDSDRMSRRDMSWLFGTAASRSQWTPRLCATANFPFLKMRGRLRSEERRVGKECRSGWSASHEKKYERSTEA